MIHDSVPRPGSRKRGNVILTALRSVVWCKCVWLGKRAQPYLGDPGVLPSARPEACGASWSFALAAFSKAAAVEEDTDLLWRKLQ